MRARAWITALWLVGAAALLPPHAAPEEPARPTAPQQVLALISQGRYAEAEAALRRGLAEGRGGPAVQYLLGQVLVRQFRFAEAEGFLRDAVAARGDRALWQHALAESLVGQGRCAAALAPLERAVQLDPRPRFRYDTAACALNVGNFALAESELRLLLQAEPRHVPALFGLGVLLADRGRNDEARRLLEDTVALQPDHVEAWFRLGLACAASGDAGAAIDALRRARAGAPAHVGAAYNLGRLLLARGDGEEGRRLLAEVPDLSARQELLENRLQYVQLDPRSAEGRAEAGGLLLEVGRLSDARVELEAARLLDPSRAETHRLLAEVYRRLGMVEESDAALACARRLGGRP
jgi:predicted Zn-dependent protease